VDAAALHREAVVVDCHNDLPMVLLLHERSLHAMGRRDYLADTWVSEFRAGGVDVQVVPVYLDPSVAEGALRHALLALEAFRREVERSPDDLVVCESFAEIEAALAQVEARA
jgi:membrane dipeptidase